jgi:hypothetical protein
MYPKLSLSPVRHIPLPQTPYRGSTSNYIILNILVILVPPPYAPPPIYGVTLQPSTLVGVRRGMRCKPNYHPNNLINI